MVKHLKSILRHSSKHGEFPYDWGAGVIVYIIAISAIFIGSIIMEVSAYFRLKTTQFVLCI